MGLPKISVVAVIDLDGRHVRLVVTGRLTVDTQSVLHLLIRRARALTPLTRVVVDLTDARIAEKAAVEALTRHAGQGHTGHPSHGVRFALPAPITVADAEDLRRLRAEQRSRATSSTVEDDHSAGRHLETVPAHPKAIATARHGIPGASPDRRTVERYVQAMASRAQPPTSTHHVTGAADPPAGTVLPLRPPRHLAAPQHSAPRPLPARPDRTDKCARR